MNEVTRDLIHFRRETKVRTRMRFRISVKTKVHTRTQIGFSLEFESAYAYAPSVCHHTRAASFAHERKRAARRACAANFALPH